MNAKVDESGESWFSEGLMDADVSSRSLAGDASYSVAQFYRRFRKDVGDPPLQLRRRLLLERAAYELTRTESPISEIALRARYESFEGFSRGFRHAFGVAPRRYRALKITDYRLDPSHAVHFAPLNSTEADRQGAIAMNMIERLCGAHYLNMKLILDRCETLTDEQLDLPIENYYDPLPWMSGSQTLRTLLQHIVGTGAPWPGVPAEKVHDLSTLAGLRDALDERFPRFMSLVASHESEGLWDLTFVDAECDPPMVFSYGGWIGHVIVFENYRRIALMAALKSLGIEDLPYCDPVDYQGTLPESIAPWSLRPTVQSDLSVP